MSEKKKRVIILCVLCLLIVILFVVYFVVDKMMGEREETKALSNAPVQLFNFDGDTVNKITISNDEGDFVFEFQNTEWVMTSGGDFEINSYVISTILNYMSSLQSSSTITDAPKDDSVYGMDNPVTLSCYLEDSSIMTLIVGDPTPTSSGYYVKSTLSNTIYTVDYSYGAMFCVSKDTLKNTYFLDTYSTFIDYFYFERDGKLQWELSKDSDDLWKITNPLQYTIYGSKVNSFCDTLVHTSVRRFVEENPTDLSAYGLTNPWARLKLHSTDSDSGVEKSCDVIFGNYVSDRDDCYECYAMFMDTKQVFTVYTTDVGCMEASTKDVILPYIYEDIIENISRIQVSTPKFDADMEIDIANEHFVMDGKVLEDMNQNVVSLFKEFYNSVLYLSMEDVDLDATPEGEASLTFTYTRTQSPEEVIIELIPSKEDSNIYYVMNNGTYTGFTVRQRTLELSAGIYDRYEILKNAMSKFE